MKRNTKKLLLSFLLALTASMANAEDIRFGYGLVYSLNKLESSKIDGRLSDIPAGGHASAFFVQFPLKKNFFLEVSPGAMNFDTGNSQFHAQFNCISVGYKRDATFYPIVAAGVGGALATLTEGPGTNGEIQSGYFVRNTTVFWKSKVGFGFQINDAWDVTVDGVGIGFFEKAFSNLNTYNVGATISYKLK